MQYFIQIHIFKDRIKNIKYKYKIFLSANLYILFSLSVHLLLSPTVKSCLQRTRFNDVSLSHAFEDIFDAKTTSNGNKM